MFESVNKGLIRECGSKKYMEWTIDNYFSIPQWIDHCIKSPSFSFCNEMWYFVIYPYGQNITESAGWVSIYLEKQYPTGLKQTLRFKIGLKIRLNNTIYKSYKGAIISEGTLRWGTPKLCQQSDLKNERSKVAPFNILTAFCTLQASNDEFIQERSSIIGKCVAGINRTVKFDPPCDVDTIMVGGVSTAIGTRLQCITAMKDFENKSFEELHLEDYSFTHQKIESLHEKSSIKGDSGFQSVLSTPSFFTRSSFIDDRKIVRPIRFQFPSTAASETEDNHPSFTFGTSSQKRDTLGFVKKSGTFSIGSITPVKPVESTDTISNNGENEKNDVLKQFTFQTTSKEKDTVAGETQDNPFGISQKSGTFSFGSIIPVKPSESTVPMNEDEIVQKTQKDSEMVDYEKEKELTEDEDEIVQKTQKDSEMVDYEKEKELTEGLNRLSEDLKELYVNNEDTDMVFKIQDKEFKVHKTIIMARSPVLAKMFKHDMMEKDGFVEITDCDSDVFQEFLLYLYSGKAESFSFDKVLGLYEVTDKYDVQILKSLCVKFMIQNLCVENFCKVLSLAVQFKESDLLESATKFFVKYMKNIIVTVDWINFLKKYPVEANELHIKAIN